MVTNGKLMKSAVHLTMDLQALIRPRWSDSKLVSHSCKTKLEGLKMCLYFAPRLLRMRMALVSKSLSHETRLLACSPPTVTHRNPHQLCLSTSGAVAGSWLLALLRAPPAGLSSCWSWGLFYSPLPFQQGHGALDEFPPLKRTWLAQGHRKKVPELGSGLHSPQVPDTCLP